MSNGNAALVIWFLAQVNDNDREQNGNISRVLFALHYPSLNVRATDIATAWQVNVIRIAGLDMTCADAWSPGPGYAADDEHGKVTTSTDGITGRHPDALQEFTAENSGSAFGSVLQFICLKNAPWPHIWLGIGRQWRLKR